jgi:DNA primase
MARAQRSGAQITIGTDNDRAGDELANKLQDLAPEEARLKRVVPAEGKDFNELLQHVIEMQQDRGMERDRGGGMEMGR